MANSAGAIRVLAFLQLFTALFLLALVVTVASESSGANWIGAIVRIGEGLGRLTFVSIAITFILVERIPMLAAWYKKQMENKGREEGRAAEREAWQKWAKQLDEWELLRTAAVNEGREFSEPRPIPPSGDWAVESNGGNPTGGEGILRLLSCIGVVDLLLLGQPALVGIGESAHGALDVVGHLR